MKNWRLPKYTKISDLKTPKLFVIYGVGHSIYYQLILVYPQYSLLKWTCNKKLDFKLSDYAASL